MRQNIRIQIAQQQWIDHQIADQIKVTPEEVEKFYKEGPPSKFDAPEMVTRQPHPRRPSAATPRRRRRSPPKRRSTPWPRASRKGNPSRTWPRSGSDDPTAKNNGGDLDYFSRERIMPEFADAAFKLKVGEVSAPVRTQFGYHLIKLTDRKPAHTATFDEARGQITDVPPGRKAPAPPWRGSSNRCATTRRSRLFLP